MELKLLRLSGTELSPHLDAVGRLRIDVFRDFPYLYEGDLDYERHYLGTYLRTPQSHLTLVYDRDQLVGATTAILAEYEEAAFQEPFRRAGIEPSTVCYFGESLLRPAYRGRGLGKTFFVDRLAFAARFPEIRWASFCAVVRPPDHPAKPSDYRPLDDFWRSLGFAPQPGLTTTYRWRDVGEQIESEKVLQFWLRRLT